MNNLFSENKYIEIIIKALLVLTAMNFMHYGQFILPIICLLLFIDNKFKLQIRDMKLFVLLCLFAITFYIFSYKLGFYCVMGFTLPFAYYIGSNIKDPNEDKIKQLIYILAFGMIIHVLLNFGYEYINIGIVKVFRKTFHLDFWTKDYISTTNTASNLLFIISFIFYLIFIEKNKKIKIIGIILFLVSSIYGIAIARRSPIFIFAISFFLSFLLYAVLNKKSIKKFVLISGIMIVLFGGLLYLFTKTTVYDYLDNVIWMKLIKRIQAYGLSTDRLTIFIACLKLIPQHLWGGAEISTITGVYFHDLFFDILDYAGIIPFIIMVIIFVIFIKRFIVSLREKKFSKDFMILIVPFIIGTGLELMLEPVFTGMSLYLILLVIIYSGLDSLYKNEK